jgi:hypothetical protein
MGSDLVESQRAEAWDDSQGRNTRGQHWAQNKRLNGFL